MYVFNLKPVNSVILYMIYGELVFFPFVLDIKYRTISYWIENAISDNVKLSTKTYLMLYNVYNVNAVKSKWSENGIDIERNANTNVYKHFKTSFGISNYITILDKNSCKRLTAFLTRNHRLPIEIGKGQNS